VNVFEAAPDARQKGLYAPARDPSVYE